MSIYSPQEKRTFSVKHREAYALVSSLLMRKALNVTDSMTKSSSGKAKVQLSILTPNRASLLLFEGEAGFLRLITMLKVGWTMASAGGGLAAPWPSSRRINAPLIWARSAEPETLMLTGRSL